jgi:hypothetical protein
MMDRKAGDTATTIISLHHPSHDSYCPDEQYWSLMMTMFLLPAQLLMMDSEAGDTATTIISLHHPIYDKQRSILTFFAEAHALGDGFTMRAGGAVEAFVRQSISTTRMVWPTPVMYSV